MLIAIGVVLQVVAICAFIRGRSLYSDPSYSGETGIHVREQEMKSRVTEKAPPVKTAPMRNPSVEGTAYAKTGIGIGNLTRTAKVKFVQTFKFRA